MKNHIIKIKEGLTMELSAKEFTDLHDRLTTYYNDNYEELTETE
jgi:hypothetical protein